MDITGDEREFWRGMRALTINIHRDEVFVGLDATESEEFLTLTRRNELGEDLSSFPAFVALRDKHERARQEVVNGQASLDHHS